LERLRHEAFPAAIQSLKKPKRWCSFMFPAQRPAPQLGERVFLSADVSRLGGITLRQLQWWDERKIISPRKEGHRRLYSLRQVLEILTAAELRHKGLSLHKVRRVLRSLRRQLPRLEESKASHAQWLVLTDGQAVYLEQQAEAAVRVLSESRKPMYLVQLSGHIEKLNTENPPHRYATRQLPLF
jgi:DNA-binding transcriptional MerR regulator